MGKFVFHLFTNSNAVLSVNEEFMVVISGKLAYFLTVELPFNTIPVIKIINIPILCCCCLIIFSLAYYFIFFALNVV